MILRNLDYLTNLQEHNGVAISATLKCPCGCDTFSFHYKGKQTKGIFAPHIMKSNRQLGLKATCEHCHNAFVLYDSSIDGSSPEICAEENEFLLFILPKSDQIFYKAIVMYRLQNNDASKSDTHRKKSESFRFRIFYLRTSHAEAANILLR